LPRFGAHELRLVRQPDTNGILANLLDNFIVMINGGQVLDDGPFRLLGRKHRL
jgi:hypothetical protein